MLSWVKVRRAAFSTVTENIKSPNATLDEKRRAILKLSCDIFGTIYNPTNARIGSRFLERSLLGNDRAAHWPMSKKEMLHANKALENQAIFIDHDPFHGRAEEEDPGAVSTLNVPGKGIGHSVHTQLTALREANRLLPMDTDEVYRRTVVERNKARNKGPPKKGLPKRTGKKK